MQRLCVAAIAVFSVLVSLSGAFAQTGNSSMGGFVQDTSRAFIPGVTVTAMNAQTGVALTAVTNEAGAYNITSLLPGTYKLSAELPGFRPHIINDVQLGANASARINFT